MSCHVMSHCHVQHLCLSCHIGTARNVDVLRNQCFQLVPSLQLPINSNMAQLSISFI